MKSRYHKKHSLQLSLFYNILKDSPSKRSDKNDQSKSVKIENDRGKNVIFDLNSNQKAAKSSKESFLNNLKENKNMIVNNLTNKFRLEEQKKYNKFGVIGNSSSFNNNVNLNSGGEKHDCENSKKNKSVLKVKSILKKSNCIHESGSLDTNRDSESEYQTENSKYQSDNFEDLNFETNISKSEAENGSFSSESFSKSNKPNLKKISNSYDASNDINNKKTDFSSDHDLFRNETITDNKIKDEKTKNNKVEKTSMNNIDEDKTPESTQKMSINLNGTTE